jgi:hypothetical protein
MRWGREDAEMKMEMLTGRPTGTAVRVDPMLDGYWSANGDEEKRAMRGRGGHKEPPDLVHRIVCLSGSLIMSVR